VICCRCSPTQKAQIVEKIKKYLNKKQRTCAIGDGGNDVSMILKADVGIGIVGKEGLQASLSSDFSITKFSTLNDLFLWHGSNTYKNTAKMSNFIIHRGLIISFIQMLFSCVFYFNSVALYNGFLILGYSTIYTIFPSMSLLLDVETKYETIKKHPDLYKILLKGRELNIKNFLGWFWKSIFQASIIIFASISLFGENIFLKIVTITFTELIFAEILNVYVEIKTFNKYIYYSLVGTGITYLLSLLLLKDLLNVVYIFDLNTLKMIVLVAVVDWLPIQIFVWIRKKCVKNLNEIYEENDCEIELNKISDI
jgi:phospholipid-translocating ATPase